MSDQSGKELSAVKELALWLAIGLFLSAMALSGAGAAKYLFGWSDSQWAAGAATVALFSVTWGSWAALLWTRRRVLKALMVVVTVLPGALMALVGLWAFFHMPENPWLWRAGWLVVVGHGVGAVAVAVVMAGGQIMAVSQAITRGRRLAMGWTLYPLIVIAGGLLVVATSFALLPDLLCGQTPGGLASVARWVVPSQALVLGTTIVPALAVHICRYVTRQR